MRNAKKLKPLDDLRQNVLSASDVYVYIFVFICSVGATNDAETASNSTKVSKARAFQQITVKISPSPPTL